jgi:betaine-aldehyde dehydrogenase
VQHDRDDVLIGGAWRHAGAEWIEVTCPSTEEVVARARLATAVDLDLAVQAARTAVDTGPWPRMSWAERSEVILAALAAVRGQAEEIGRLITAEMGVPLLGAIKGQVPSTVAMGRATVGHAESFATETAREGRLGWALIAREPVGVVGAIAPWNGPFYFAVLKTVSAMLAGCSVVLKPAAETPLDAFYFGEALYAAGLPEGVLSILPGGAEFGAELVRHRGVDKVTFTGSTLAGRQVAAECGASLKRCSLELGGKSAAIVLADADLDQTIPALQAGAFFNSGQVCAALTRVLAPAERYDEVVERLATAAAELVVGDPYDAKTVLGPLVAERQRDRVEGYLRVAAEEGATCVTGGGRPKHLERGWYIEPTVLSEVHNGMRVVREEIFGPVVSVLRYENLEEAIAIANDSAYGLHGGVYTADPEQGVALARRLVTGSVSVNSFTLNHDAPFGGRKDSGIGREFGPEGIASFLEYKTINVPAEVGQAHAAR